MNASVYRLETADIAHPVAHLYEHVVLHQLFELLATNGFEPGSAGWLTGVTFEDCIYLDIGLYDPAAARLCERFIQKRTLPDSGIITHNLRIIECEERARITVTDPDALKSQLDELRQRTWTDGSLGKVAARNTDVVFPLRIQKKASVFRNVTFDFFHDSFSPDEAKLFQRLSVIMHDTLHRQLYRDQVGYYRDSSEVTSYGESGMSFSTTFTVPRGQLTTHAYTDFAAETLNTLGMAEAFPAIRRHFEAIAQSSQHAGLAIDYYRSSGVVTSTAELLRLATPELVATIIDKVYVHCHPTSASDPS